MFSGPHRLGEAPGADCIAPGGFPDWIEPKVPEGDFDMISIAYYSPDASYPKKRIGNYNLPLDEQRTALNGVGAFSNLPTRNRYTEKSKGPGARFK